MGYEDAETKSDSTSTAVSDTPFGPGNPIPDSYPLSQGERDIEMRNLPESSLGRSGSRSPVEGLRRRLSMDPEAKKERQKVAEERKNQREVPVAVVEQRLSNLAQGCLCQYCVCLPLLRKLTHSGLVLMTSPFQHVLGLIPKGVLAGLFVSTHSHTHGAFRYTKEDQGLTRQWYMGTDALLTSGVTEKMLYLVRDPRAISPTNPLNKVRKTRILLFLAVELVGFGATFAVTQVSSLLLSIEWSLKTEAND
jgi:hypothetical protein